MPSISAQNLDLTNKALLIALAEDTAALRAAMVALVAKLDADGGVTDTDYAATCTPAALTVTD